MAGLFTQLGIDTRSEEQILADRATQLQQAGAGLFRDRAERFQGQNAAERGGFMIGAGLLQAGADRGILSPQLTPSEARQVEVQQAATARFNKAVKADPKLAADPEMKSLEQQRILGEEMVRNGDVRGFEVLNQTNAAKVKLRTDRVNREMLVANTARTEQVTKHADVKQLRDDLTWKRGESKQVWKRGDKDPNNGFVAYQNADGRTFTDSQGNVYESHEITTFRPTPDEPERSLQGTRGTGVTARELGEFRKMMVATATQARGAVRMKRAMEASLDATGKVTIMDGAGRISEAVVKTIDVVGALATQVESALDPEARAVGILDGDFAGKNMASKGTSLKYATANQEELDALAKETTLADGKTTVWDIIPDNIRKNSRARVEYFATLSQLVYARARANEPGARQLSDNDYKNALMGMAAATNDPEAFRRTMLGNIQEDVANVALMYDMFPDELKRRNAIMGKDGFDRWSNTIQEFQQEFGPAFTPEELGSPQAPNPTDPAEPRTTDFSNVTGSGDSADDPIVIPL